MDTAKNFVYGLVKTAPSPATSGTSLVLDKTDYGDLFPDPAVVGAYNLVVWATASRPLASNSEIVRVTAKSDNVPSDETTLTIVRIQEDTSARTIVAGDQIALNLTAKAITDLQALSNSSIHRQAIINGNFDIWQRGTSFTATGYTADRWKMAIGGTTATVSRQAFTVNQSDVPNNPQYYLRNVVSSSAGAGNYCVFQQPVENGARLFGGKTITLTFWAKADANKNICIEFYKSFGSGGSPSADVNGIAPTTVALTTSWAKKTVTVTIPDNAGKTFGTNNDDYLNMIIWLDAGSNFNARTNSLGQQSGTFELSQFVMNLGSVTLPFMPNCYADELRACQRYFYASTSVQATFKHYCIGVVTSTTRSDLLFLFPVPMRTIPSFSSSAASTFVTNGQTLTAIALDTNVDTSESVIIIATAASGLTAGDGARLYSNNTTSGYLFFDAEI